MIFKPLTTNERAETPGYTHVGIVTADDLTASVVDAVQTIEFCKLLAGDQVRAVAWFLKTPFQQTGVAGNNVTTASVGDVAAVGTHLAAAETNLNGTEIIWRAGNTAVLYTAADKFATSWVPKTGTALNVINRGELLVFVALARLRYVAEAMAATLVGKT